MQEFINLNFATWAKFIESFAFLDMDLGKPVLGS